MKKLLITRVIAPSVIADAKARFDVTVRQTGAGMTLDEAAEALASYDAILPTLGDDFSADAFARAGAPRCKVLANFGVGYNHIDAAAAKAAGVAVSNTPDVLTDATADIGMTLLLTAARRTGEGERMVRAGKWKGWGPGGIMGTHVSGKTVGIVGMGRIGQAVARRCHHGFGMPVLFYNRSPKTVDVPARQVADLAEMLGAVDFVVVTVPGGAQTRNLIDAAAFRAMKPSAIFVNIARGEVVDEAALIEALRSGQIAAAGLDVFVNEPDVPLALREMENTVVVPHLGSATAETREAMGRMALGNVIAWAEGRPLPQAV